MIGNVAKWGNSLALRIPSAFAREIDVSEGAAVDISIADGALVIRRIDDSPVYDLEKLLGAITEDNRHDETATGKSIGNEF